LSLQIAPLARFMAQPDLPSADDGHAQSDTATSLQMSDVNSRALVQVIEDYAIVMVNPDGYVASWNTGAASMTGYCAEEIVGRHCACFYIAEAIEQGLPQRELELARDHGQYECDGWRVRKDGSAFWANVVTTALRDNGGRLTGFAKVIRDLTVQRRQQEALSGSEERF
jgi:PAS domain S-box-containing protein